MVALARRRLVRSALFACAACSAIACAAIVGIEEREPLGPTQPPTSEAGIEGGVPDDPDAASRPPECAPAACTDAGGACDGSTCVIQCGSGDCPRDVVCPPTIEACEIRCGSNACTNV